MAYITISAGFDPADVVAKLAPRPVLIIAAERDEICYPEEARALYDAAGQPKDFWLVPGAAHLEIALEARAELTRRVTNFFANAID